MGHSNLLNHSSKVGPRHLCFLKAPQGFLTVRIKTTPVTNNSGEYGVWIMDKASWVFLLPWDQGFPSPWPFCSFIESPVATIICKDSLKWGVRTSFPVILIKGPNLNPDQDPAEGGWKQLGFPLCFQGAVHGERCLLEWYLPKLVPCSVESCGFLLWGTSRAPF